MKGTVGFTSCDEVTGYKLTLHDLSLSGCSITVLPDTVEIDPQSQSCLSISQAGSTLTIKAFTYNDTDRMIRMFEFASLVLRELRDCDSARLEMIAEADKSATEQTGLKPDLNPEAHVKWAKVESKILKEKLKDRPSIFELRDRINRLAYGALPPDADQAEDTDW